MWFWTRSCELSVAPVRIAVGVWAVVRGSSVQRSRPPVCCFTGEVRGVGRGDRLDSGVGATHPASARVLSRAIATHRPAKEGAK
jgi:hypothetical protein